MELLIYTGSGGGRSRNVNLHLLLRWLLLNSHETVFDGEVSPRARLVSDLPREVFMSSLLLRRNATLATELLTLFQTLLIAGTYTGDVLKGGCGFTLRQGAKIAIT